jgi:Na+-transporting NADH:ubiquinone oxidoreductase subunit NqrC
MLSEDLLKRRGKTIHTKNPLSIEIKKSIYMLVFSLLSIIVLVSIVYLLNSSQSTQKGYSLKQEQLQKDGLVEESNDLIRKIIQAQSFTNIENSDLVKSMIKPENPVYIDMAADPANSASAGKKR